jgi:PAS domain S-box-containing protein
MALIAEADIEIDPDGLVVGWDSGAVRLFGYQATEALGVALSDLIVPGRLRAAHRDGLRRIRSGTGPHPVLDAAFELPALHRDGHEVLVEALVTRRGPHFGARLRPVAAAAPVPLELFLSASGRERRETAQLRALVGVLPEGVVVQDEQRHTVVASFTDEFADPWAAEIKIDAIVRAGVPVADETVDLADGRTLVRDYTPVLLDGASVGHVWVYRPPPPRAISGPFIRMAAHELRTPLASLSTLTGMLSTLDGVQLETALAAVERNVGRMQAAIADLLALAALQCGETRVESVPVDLAPLVTPRLLGDPHLLRQVFDTVVDVVTGAADPHAPVRLSSTVDGGWAVVTVHTDTAEPAGFERLLTGTLALSLAEEIVVRHRGTLTTSVERPGITVTVRIPAFSSPGVCPGGSSAGVSPETASGSTSHPAGAAASG